VLYAKNLRRRSPLHMVPFPPPHPWSSRRHTEVI
jgi:hypothetical protein